MFDLRTFLEKAGDKKADATLVRHLDRKQLVYAQGDVADSVYYILRGKIKLTVVSGLGKEAVIALLQKGDFFGESCLAGIGVRMSSADAVEHSTVIQIKKSTMMTMLHEEPEYAELFMAYMLSRNIRMEEDLIDQLFNSSEKRLARLLLLLAQYGKEREPQPIFPRMTQELLAEMVGTTRSRVNSFMNKFRKMGLIDYRDDGGLIVHKSLLNVILLDKD